MNKQVFRLFFIFAIITFFLFFGGILGVLFAIKNINDIRELEKIGTTENAMITGIELRSRTINNTIYFVTKNEGKTYETNLIKVHPGKIKAGDEIKVKFNEDRTLFLITTYQSAVYIGYFVQIGLFAVCFAFSVFALLATIEIYKKGCDA